MITERVGVVSAWLAGENWAEGSPSAPVPSAPVPSAPVPSAPMRRKLRRAKPSQNPCRGVPNKVSKAGAPDKTTGRYDVRVRLSYIGAVGCGKPDWFSL